MLDDTFVAKMTKFKALITSSLKQVTAVLEADAAELLAQAYVPSLLNAFVGSTRGYEGWLAETGVSDGKKG